MVLCLIGLPVFAILGIFSIKYRRLTIDALECLFRTVILRKCRSGLDERIKSVMTGKAMSFSPSIAKFIYRHYKLISWLILILFIASLYVSISGIYNYAKYGNCNGPADTDFCILDPTGQNNRVSAVEVDRQREIVYPTAKNGDYFFGDNGTRLTIIEFGCYACPYTKKAEPVIKELLEDYRGRVSLQFVTFIIPRHKLSYKTSLASYCAKEYGTYPEFHNLMFEIQENLTEDGFGDVAVRLGINQTEFTDCINKEKYKSSVESDTLAGIHAGVSGTPTFFINHQKIVGPKPERTFRTIIEEELKK